MAVDVGKELRRSVDTGRVLFGKREVEKSVLKGECKLVIASGNAERYASERMQQLCDSVGVTFYRFDSPGLEIGSYCGKPFVVSFAGVEDGGKSKLLELAKEKKKR